MIIPVSTQAARQRRQQLIQAMSRLESDGFHCFDCTGVCCTFVANSMMTTPHETAELLNWLIEEDRLTPQLITSLKDCVRRYRLDQPAPGDGRRTFGRRTYTCPFFAGTQKGCTISRGVKPYGCLGFNAIEKGITDGGSCQSNVTLLQEFEDTHKDVMTELDHQVIQKTGIDPEKKPMPQALLEMIATL